MCLRFNVCLKIGLSPPLGNHGLAKCADFCRLGLSYRYAMEISPPSNMQQHGGVKVGSDGKFQMDNISEDMRCVVLFA